MTATLTHLRDTETLTDVVEQLRDSLPIDVYLRLVALADEAEDAIDRLGEAREHVQAWGKRATARQLIAIIGTSGGRE